ncbi:hypothetical protein [Sebaldella sp. S0638]|uniref:hypothetical protein n=1 Tax=Sebaldella sp. S0638 TaxID=2957809 RepID=UPI00209CB735|nr:hypothetical protein [Sebaldella sp. S0638]MCP1224736.1 hypothetical protein [Sebaldella sp. S0638]
MKKIILLFMVFSLSIFSKSFDSMASKKALDKFIEIERSGDLKKYAGDKQAEAMFGISKMSEEEISDMNKGKKIIGDNYKYKITNVKETGNKSEITMNVEYEAVNYDSPQMKAIILELESKYGKQWFENSSNEEITDKFMEKYTDFSIVKKTIKVNMEKQNGYWDIDLNENNDFMISLYSHGELYFWHE